MNARLPFVRSADVLAPTCAVRCVIHDSIDGNPVEGATVNFLLSSFEIDSQAPVTAGYIAPESGTGTCDANGECIVMLWPNERGVVESFYNVRIQAKGKTFKTTAVIPDVPACNLWDVAETPPFDGQSQAQIITAEIILYMQRAEAAAVAAEASADAAETSANNAGTSEANAANSETNAAASEIAAADSAAEALASQEAAKISEDAAHQSYLDTVAVAQSVGLSGAAVNPDGDLIITRGDGTEYNAGYVIGAKGEKGDTGASITVLGTLPDEGSLPPVGAPGDAWIIGGDLWIWNEDGQDWTNAGPFVGPPGPTDWNLITNKPPLGTASPRDVAPSGNANSQQVVLGNDTRLTDARAPTAHVHPISQVTGLQAALDLKAPLASPAFTGTVTGIDKTMVGLPNVDNTSDLDKPISTATQAALDTKIGDAPADGVQYVRKDAAWAQIVSPLKTTIADAQPVAPNYADRWIRPATGQESVWVPTTDGLGTWWAPAGADDDVELPVQIADGGTGATTAADARTNLGLDTLFAAGLQKTGGTMTGALGLASGTVAAPSLFFGAEVGLGWYRASAGRLGFASSGQQVAEFASAATDTQFNLYPRAPGTGSFSVSNAPITAANVNWASLGISADGSAVLSGGHAGTGTIKTFNISGFSSMVFAVPAAQNATFYLSKTSVANASDLIGAIGTVPRWLLRLGDGQANDNFSLMRYDNGGTLVGGTVIVDRLTGLTTFGDNAGVQITGTNGLNVSNGIAAAAGMGFRYDGGNSNFLGMGGGLTGSWAFQWNRSNGALTWLGGSTQALVTIDGGGTISAAGQLRSGAGPAMFGDPGASYISLQGIGSPWSWQWIKTNGSLNYLGGSSEGLISFDGGGNAYKSSGAGPWLAQSDERIKDIHEDYTNGLDAILALKVRWYSYKDDGVKRIGLIAQEAKVPMPETVTIAPGERGGIKLEDMHIIDITPVTWALVNAVKELTERLTALEAA